MMGYLSPIASCVLHLCSLAFLMALDILIRYNVILAWFFCISLQVIVEYCVIPKVCEDKHIARHLIPAQACPECFPLGMVTHA